MLPGMQLATRSFPYPYPDGPLLPNQTRAPWPSNAPIGAGWNAVTSHSVQLDYLSWFIHPERPATIAGRLLAKGPALYSSMRLRDVLERAATDSAGDRPAVVIQRGRDDRFTAYELASVDYEARYANLIDPAAGIHLLPGGTWGPRTAVHLARDGVAALRLPGPSALPGSFDRGIERIPGLVGIVDGDVVARVHAVHGGLVSVEPTSDVLARIP